MKITRTIKRTVNTYIVYEKVTGKLSEIEVDVTGVRNVEYYARKKLDEWGYVMCVLKETKVTEALYEMSLETFLEHARIKGTEGK